MRNEVAVTGVGSIQIRTRSDADAGCLMRELGRFSPERELRTITIGLDDGAPTADLFAVLAAVDACLRANEIPSVRVELDGRVYMLVPQRVS